MSVGTVQVVLVPLQAPPHPTNTLLDAGDAVRVTVRPSMAVPVVGWSIQVGKPAGPIDQLPCCYRRSSHCQPALTDQFSSLTRGIR